MTLSFSLSLPFDVGGPQHGARGKPASGERRAAARGEPHEGRGAGGRGSRPQDPRADVDSCEAESPPPPPDSRRPPGRRPPDAKRRHIREETPALAVALQSQVRPRELAARLAAARAEDLAALRPRGSRRLRAGPREGARPREGEEAGEVSAFSLRAGIYIYRINLAFCPQPTMAAGLPFALSASALDEELRSPSSFVKSPGI